jgi:hypothetical protein
MAAPPHNVPSVKDLELLMVNDGRRRRLRRREDICCCEESSERVASSFLNKNAKISIFLCIHAHNDDARDEYNKSVEFDLLAML